ncbi:nucleoside-diphosphate-sugar epimerase [Bradyrhizobium diazoefficiens]|uniref:NAD-dependent epimerase/dehydratase family protein n=1 Tax=Bradyrhizobium TaxID=374 RepID=UPI0015FF5F59|nr:MULTISPECIES: NAD(P)H-binding protein [Bradyrhizobium]MBP1063778.1 nucleoside-diphosphate-sugar epimerase [Bradyrhizobium japonicum]
MVESKSLVIGASGIVGSRIVERLLVAGERPTGLSRNHRRSAGVTWIRGDLLDPQSVAWPDVEIIYCTASARLLADAIPSMARPSLRRVVLFTTTSISTKVDSADPEERAGLAAYARAEMDVIEGCESRGIGWTVLRPTLIYDEGRDVNVTRIASLISKIRFFPLCGRGHGLRQPVHAADCAIAAVSAVSTARAENKIYNLPGGETITYREMIGRIFDGIDRARCIVPVPPFLWEASFHLLRSKFPHIKPEMGKRMAKNMVFDQAPARSDLEWKPRPFKPSFRGVLDRRAPTADLGGVD